MGTKHTKEKAKELVGRFDPYAYTNYATQTLREANEQSLENAKQCAIICVEEILKQEEELYRNEGSYFNYHFWKDVKAEIEAI